MTHPASALSASSSTPGRVSCSSSLPTPNSTPYTSTHPATQSSRLASPSRMGWGPVAARAPDVQASSDGLANLLDWVAGCVLVYGVLFGVGKPLRPETRPGVPRRARRVGHLPRPVASRVERRGGVTAG